jgi:hypothetical protein
MQFHFIRLPPLLPRPICITGRWKPLYKFSSSSSSSTPVRTSLVSSFCQSKSIPTGHGLSRRSSVPRHSSSCVSLGSFPQLSSPKVCFKTSRETVIRPKHPTPRISCRNDEIFTTFSIPRHLASSNVRASDRSQIARYESSNQSVTPCFWPRTILSIDEPIRASCLMAKSLMDSNCHLAARFKIEVHSSTVVAEYTPI